MPNTSPERPPLQFRLPTVVAAGTASRSPPAILREVNRSAGTERDPFISDAVIQVEASYDLLAPSRGDAAATTTFTPSSHLLALEAEDGTTLFISAEKLQARLQQLYPEAIGADGVIDLGQLRDRETATRGLGDWVWSKLSILNLTPDNITEQAQAKLLELVQDALADKLHEQYRQELETSLSWVGAKSLMWAIESRLAGEQGLYRWREQELAPTDHIPPDDAALKQAVESAKPILLFIHGTASSTTGSFGGLGKQQAAQDWSILKRHFGEHIYGFEHRTFSESPIDNALMLARSLPAGARLFIVTHSRGGLIGDLLCTGRLDDKLVKQYRRSPRPSGAKESDAQRDLRQRRDWLEQKQLRELSDLLEQKNFHIERYLRVACPAGGTPLLSDNLDLFLSGLLSLMNLLVGPFTSGLGSAMLSAFKRIVLEIAKERFEAHMVPGIEAMLVDAPMGVLLANAPRRPGINMAVIAGDMAGGHLLKRLAVMFTSWMFFDRVGNDLVVDTRSMFAGLARQTDTFALFDRGQEVNHFRYFNNHFTRKALHDWLGGGSPQRTVFGPLHSVRELGQVERSATSQTQQPTGKRPVVVVLPDFMGSHLQVTPQPDTPEGKRVWLDVAALMESGLESIRMEQKNILPEAPVELFYGQLAGFLQTTHDVVPFPYDWRQPIETSADLLARKLEVMFVSVPPQQPVHLLAHGMGGLVVRAMLTRSQDAPEPANLWERMVKRGGRFVMLGTPNQGCYLPVSTLLGKSSLVRKLARLDTVHSMPEIIQTLGSFPGLLQLLPQTSGKEGAELAYFDAATWAMLKAQNHDPWFGDGLAAQPDQGLLQTASAVWQTRLLSHPLTHPEHLAYVFGKAAATDCGLEKNSLKLAATGQGDGVVTWQSGKLAGLPDDRYWLMPVEHGALADTPEYFAAIHELLDSGETRKLERGMPGSSRGSERIRHYQPGSEAYPNEEEFMRGIYNGEPRYQPAAGKLPGLDISVRAMDLRFAQLPVMCGHYAVDAISGAESLIDEYLVNGTLRQRERLGVYADDIGSSTIVLNKRSTEEKRRGTGKGAVVIGLGDWSKISTQRITEAVAEGVLNFLLHHLENGLVEEQEAESAEGVVLSLSSLLIGYNSTTHISVEASVDAIVRGVCEANQRFSRNTHSQLWVGKLEFIELYRDTAITAAYAVRSLPTRLEKEFQRYQIAVKVTDTLNRGKGMRSCWGGNTATGYWPRLIVTNDRPEERHKADRKAAEYIKYVFLSERARAEGVVQQRQPDLIERLIRQSLCSTRYNRDIARTLFQLMVPLDFKAVARQTDHLLLVVDADTANLPWEMLQADDEPLVLHVSMVRQLVSMRFRRTVNGTVQRSACVIGNPSTAGYYTHFKPDYPEMHGQPLRSLPGAAREAARIRAILDTAPQGYEVEYLYPAPETADPHHQAMEVFNTLYRRPYRILAIAAHGVVDAEHADGKKRTGVVLSDGLLLTAAEIGQMEVVPELVFLNCCHLAVVTGGTDGKAMDQAAGDAAAPVAYNRLAYSVAQELIEIGVRCVVAAGWAVEDEAATLFAETFFKAFVHEQQPFGVAIHKARKATHAQDPNCNTWGAYQAYGDPAYVLDTKSDATDDGRSWNPVDPEELVEKLQKQQMEAKRQSAGKTDDAYRQVCQTVQGWLGQVPADWQKLATVQFALGTLYAEYIPHPESFQQARAAYQAAINGIDTHGWVPVKAVEQLANLEARAAVEIDGVDAHALVDCAINRVTGLLEVTEGIEVKSANGLKQVAEEQETHGLASAERWSLLGSAWKRKAILQQRAHASWAQIAEALQQSRNAYQWVEGSVDEPDCNFYAMINRLQLDGLLLDDAAAEECGRHAQQATRCLDRVRKRFADSYDFFDAVMPVDAQVAVQLLARPLAAHKIGGLVDLYREAVRPVHSSDRQFDSVVRQLELFAELLKIRQWDGDAGRVQVLAETARELGREG